MASSLNRAEIIGNLTRDPEIRQTSAGQTVVNIGVATNRKWKNAAGQFQEEVEFHNVVVWGKLAEICGQYLKKGAKVFLAGRLKTSNWEKEGVKHYRTEIVADELVMLDRKSDSGGAPAASAPANQSAAPATQTPKETVPADEEVKVEDLPF